MPGNLFIIMTPFQLLCAIEARHIFKTDKKALLVIVDRWDKDHPSYQHLNALLDDEWKDILRLRETRRRGIIRTAARFYLTLRFFLWLGMQGSLRNHAVFIGESRISWLRILGRLFAQKTVWLDDGAASVFLINDLIKNNSYKTVKRELPGFFTIFGTPEIQTKTKGFIVQNHMTVLKEKILIGKKIARHKAVFAGQWLSEGSSIPLEGEIQNLKNVRSILENWHIDYAPHRLESPEKLSMISEIGFNVTRFQKPMEIALLENPEQPELFLSWYSTSLFTIKKLFPEICVVGLKIVLPGAKPDECRRIKEVYEELESQAIPTIEIHDLNSMDFLLSKR